MWYFMQVFILFRCLKNGMVFHEEETKKWTRIRIIYQLLLQVFGEKCIIASLGFSLQPGLVKTIRSALLLMINLSLVGTCHIFLSSSVNDH